MSRLIKINNIIAVIIALCLSACKLYAEEEWEKAKEKNGVVVYTRIPEGSEVKEFKAITEIETSLSSLVAAISDIDSLSKWYKNTGETKILRNIHDRKQIYYYEVLVPFPFKNRDMVQEIELQQDAKSKVVTATISNVLDYEVQSKGRVRMPIAQGSWKLTPLGNNKVSVEHQYLADPGGSIPKKIVNMLIVGGPYSSLIKLKGFIKTEKYQNARYDWIIE